MQRLALDALAPAVADRVERTRGRRAGRPFVLAVSGHGGSGKSTTAALVAAALVAAALGGVHIGTDEFFRREDDRGPGLYEVHEWDEILGLLSRLRSGGRVGYSWRWWTGEEGVVDEPAPEVVVVDGIRLIRPEVLALVDASVWLDCSPEEAGALSRPVVVCRPRSGL